MTANTREEHLFTAKVAESTQKPEYMVEAMKKVIAQDPKLNTEERQLLQKAYKFTFAPLRSTRYKLYKTETKKDCKYVEAVRSLRAKVEADLDKLCNEILDLIDTRLIPAAANTEALVQYDKLKGDFHRYMAEYTVGTELESHCQASRKAYVAATARAEADLSPTHSVRLGLALNYSVFLYITKSDKVKGTQVAKDAFDNAIAYLEQLTEEHFEHSSHIMQAIRNNLVLWTTEQEEKHDE